MLKQAFLPLAVMACMFSAPLAANAADQDIAKVSCKDFLNDKEGIPLTIMWIDGYMSAKSDNTMMNEEWIVKLTKHMATYCMDNPGKSIMAAMEAMPAE